MPCYRRVTPIWLPASNAVWQHGSNATMAMGGHTPAGRQHAFGVGGL